MLKPISYLLLSAALVGVAVADDAAKPATAQAMPAATAAAPMDAEKALAEASMNGASEADLMKQFDEMAAMRRALAEQKTKCRDHMQTILTPEQWTQVVTLQKAAL